VSSLPFQCISRLSSCPFFFFQAEDGIRDFHVTGVQTCALPILKDQANIKFDDILIPRIGAQYFLNDNLSLIGGVSFEKSPLKSRSEERRVGKECRSR